MNKKALKLLILAAVISMPLWAYSADKIIVKDGSNVTRFTVNDQGNVVSTGNYSFMAQHVNPGFWLDETGAGNKGLYYVLDGKILDSKINGEKPTIQKLYNQPVNVQAYA